MRTFHHLMSLSCLSHSVFTFLLWLIGRSWHVGFSGPLILWVDPEEAGGITQGIMCCNCLYMWTSFSSRLSDFMIPLRNH
jgi:hypothetical protein